MGICTYVCTFYMGFVFPLVARTGLGLRICVRACLLGDLGGRLVIFQGVFLSFFIGASINHKRKPYLLPTYTTYLLIPTYPYIDQLQ